jgi:peptide/nickel transport system substrate-binding protein
MIYSKFKSIVFLFLFLGVFSVIEARDTIIYLQPSDVITLDPGEATDFYSAEVISNIFEGLVRFKANSFVIEPCLASRWEIKENGRKWVFYLRKGIEFHNGETFNSDSVVYSFLIRMKKKERDYNKWNFLYSFISSVKALDEYKIEITLVKPYIPFLTILAETTNFIISPNSYRDKAFIPIGTGPFKFSKWTKGESLVIEKNNNYWSESAKIYKVVFKVVKDPQWRILQIKNKNADIISIGSAKEYDELASNNEIIFKSITSLSVHYLAFNTSKKPFDKLEVRKSVAHIINKKILNTSIFQKLAINATTPLPPHLFGFNKNIKDYNFDIKKAKTLLEKAGYHKGFTATLHFSGETNFLDKFINRLILNTKLINIKIIKKKYSFSELREIANRGEHDMLILGWAASPDPDLFLFPQFTMKKGNFNRAFYENPILTEILEKARETLSIPERERLYMKAQEIIHRDIPWIPLFHLYITKAYRNQIINLNINQLGFLVFKDSYFKNQ